MISKTTIQEFTYGASYQRGRSIYQSGEILEFDMSGEEAAYETGRIRIWALVEGSYGNEYEVEILVDESQSMIEESYCECPAFENYEGLCKHCVAVLLEYLDRRDKERIFREEQDLEALMSMLGVQKGSSFVQIKEQKIDEGLKKILERYSLRRNAPYLPESKSGQVHLEAHVKYEYGSFTVSFKIGITQMYLLKNIPQFILDMEEMNRIAYGKKLEFLHCIEAFSRESRPIAEFIMSCRKIPEFEYYRRFKILYRGVGKEIPLHEELLDRFMETAEKSEVYLAAFAGEKCKMKVEEGKIPRKLEIREEKGGVQLLPEELELVRGQDYEYAIMEESPDVIYKMPIASEEERDFLDYLYTGGRLGTYVAKEDLPAFCQNMLPILEKHCVLSMTDFLPENYLPVPVEFECYLDAPQTDMVTCRLMAVYGKESFPLFQKEQISQGSVVRDVKKELQMRQAVQEYFYAYDEISKSMALQGEEDTYRFLTEGLPLLEALAKVFISDQLKRIQVIRRVNVQVGVSLSGNLLNLQVSGEDFSRDQLAEILSRYDRKKKYYRLKNGEFIHMDEQGIRIFQEIRDELQITDRQLKLDKIPVPAYRALYLEEQLGDGIGDGKFRIEKDRDFSRLVHNMKTMGEQSCQVPKELEGVLREYQREGFSWMKNLCRSRFGGILADDMGLGKTLQTIAFLISQFEEQGKALALIVTPASLVYNWKSEFEKFAPGLKVYTVAGSMKERAAFISGFQGPGVLITSYQLLYRDRDWYEKMHFSYQVIDEAQFIKNQGNQTTHAVKEVSADFRLALTGTPVENQLSELWSIFDFVMPGYLYKYARFRREIEQPIVKNQDTAAMEKLQKMIRPFVLRRTKQEVLGELPEKIEKPMFAMLEGEQRQLYDAHVQRLRMRLSKQSEEEFAMSRIQILSELTRLRQICCDPGLCFQDYQGASAKLDLCIQLIKNAVEGGHKLLLFSQFTSMLDRIIGKLKGEGLSYYLLTGQTSKEERARLVQDFNQDSTNVFCISLKAGGTGLNLTGADMVIHYDPWWNAAVETQAADRAHRIGQTQVLTVYKLIVRHTIEEKIVELQARKRELAGQVLGGEGIGQAVFTREELLELL